MHKQKMTKLGSRRLHLPKVTKLTKKVTKVTLFIQILQDLVMASFFSLILFRICFIFFIVSFDHVTSYFVFSCDDFDRLLCAQGKVCHL